MKDMDQTEYAYKNGYRKALEDVRKRLGAVMANAVLAEELQGYADDFRWGTREGCDRCILAVENMMEEVKE